MLNCQALTKYILDIKTDKNRLDNFIEGRSIGDAKKLQAKLQSTIKKLRFTIDLKDMELLPEQIALNQAEVSDLTKMYSGPLFANIFQQYPNLERIYTAFPEGKIIRGELVTSGKSGKELTTEMRNNGIEIWDPAETLLNCSEFVIDLAKEIITTIRLKVNDLFLDDNKHTYADILERAAKFGLTKLPHEAGPDLILNKEIQFKMGEYIIIVSESFKDQDRFHELFRLHSNSEGLVLCSVWADPEHKWDPDSELIFRLIPSSPPVKLAQKEDSK